MHKEVVEYFKERLLTSPVRDCITKIPLFGSVAKGESKAESDIDLLIGGKLKRMKRLQ
jgi:predicted nucleotidyltransferase